MKFNALSALIHASYRRPPYVDRPTRFLARFGIYHTIYFLFSLLIVLLSAQAHSVETKPRYFYKIGCANNGCPGNYKTPDDAFQAFIAWANSPDVTFFGLHVDPSSAPPLDGNQEKYNFYYYDNNNPQYVQNGILIWLVWECGEMQSSRGVYVNGTLSGIRCIPPPEPQECPKCGNPIVLATGIKEQVEADYVGLAQLKLVRKYRSDRNGWKHNFEVIGRDFTRSVDPNQQGAIPGCWPDVGRITHEPYCFPYATRWNSSGNDFSVQRGNGRVLEFGTATDFTPAPDINDRISPVVDSNGNTIAWRAYNAENDSTELFDLTGRLQSITDRASQVTTLRYSDANTLATVAPFAGLLISVTDSFGRQLNFTYDGQGRMTTMADPAGNAFTYAYDEPTSIVLPGKQRVGNLTSVTYPDGRKRLYWYNEQDKTSGTNLPYALTGITDENGTNFAIFKYENSGRAISTEYAGGVYKYTVAYPGLYSQSKATDPLGAIRTYNFNTLLNVVRNTSETNPAGSGTGSATKSLTYDANANVASRTDFNGNQTTHVYDLARNLETQRVEAFGTPQARTISTTWHANYRLPLTIAEPATITTFSYDVAGNLLSKSEQATTDANGSQGLVATPVGNPRTWHYTYNSVGQVLTAIDPNGGVTTHTYDTQGDVVTVTNALGQVTTFAEYDANGRVGKITDPNGLITTLTYSPRGWLTSKDVGGEITTYAYDGVGQLKTLTQPDGSTIHYTYADAHRLTDIADSLGNAIHFTLDAMGNRTGEQVKDPSGTLARQTTRAFDALNRLQSITGGNQ